MISLGTNASLRSRLRLYAIYLALAGPFGCAQAHMDPDAVDPKAPQKVPAALQIALQGGVARDVIIELQPDAADAGGGEAAGSTQGLVRDLGDVPTDAAQPMMDGEVGARAASYRALQEKVLDAVDPADVELLFQYENLPLLLVHVHTLHGLMSLAAQPEVLRLHEERLFSHELAESLPLIHQPQVAAAGDTGAGTAVAVLDTGCDYRNSAFGSCSNAGDPGCKVAYAADFAPDDHALDDNGHGTNVSAIVLGVAPATKLLALDVFDGDSAPSSAILQAIDWTISNRSTYNIAAMNLSLGAGLFTTSCDSDVFATALENARAAGILSAVASGNNGAANALSSPACAPAAISVGAVYDANVGSLQYSTCTDATTAADQITCFSNSASFLSLLAPGAIITAGGYSMAGTSQAAPHVAGALAVVRAAFPSEALNDSVARLTNNGPLLTDARNDVGKHRLDLQAAVGGGPSAHDTTPPTGSVVIDGDAASTSSSAVTLTIAGSDASGVVGMCVSNTTSCTAFSTFATSMSWTLTSGDGEKTVYVTLRDPAGNRSVVSDTIVLDTTAPVGGQISATPGDQQVTLHWSAATDALSGIAKYNVVGALDHAPGCSEGTPLYSGTEMSFTHTGLVNGSLYAYRLCPIDNAGNIGIGSTTSARPAPEFDPPQGTVLIDDGAQLTRSTAVTLTLSASDASGTTGMCISNTNSCSNWVAFSASEPWTLSTQNGVAHVYVWFRDVYQNASATPVSASITVDSTPPIDDTLSAVASSGQVAFSWTEANDASGVASYKLVFQPGSCAPASCDAGTVAYSGSGLAFTHTGLTTGSYGYRLCAIDSAGNVSSGLTKTVDVP